jgi:Transglycosylase SLT domain
MNYRMTASPDAIHACDYEDTIHWLRPHSASELSSDNARPRETFRQVTASLGLGALLTFGAAGAAFTPAQAHPAKRIQVPAKAPLKATMAKSTVSKRTAAKPTLAKVARARPTVSKATIVNPTKVAAIVAEPTAAKTFVAEETVARTVAADETIAKLGIVSDIVVPVEPADLPLIVMSEAAVQPEPSPMSAALPADRDARTVPDRIVVAAVGTDEVMSDAHPADAGPLAGVAAAESGSGNDPRDMLQFDNMRVPRWIVETILKAADVTGVDPVYMMALADKESSFIPANKASTSSAEGLFQFISSTWLEVVHSFGAKHGLAGEADLIQRTGGQLAIEDEAARERVLGLRRDPYLSALMAAEMMKRDRAKVESKLGRPITRSEFYLSHFFGVDSASKFMALLDGKPKQSAPRVFPKAARANRTLFFARKGRKTRHLSVAEVYTKTDVMIDKRLDRYQGVMTKVADATH